MSTSNRKKSTSQTTLPDGTKVKEYIVEETQPDGSRTITTTQVKTFKVTRTLPDGSKVTEDVSNTTTTTKQCPQPQPVQEDLVQQAANGFGTFLDLFTSTKKTEAKEVKATDMNAAQVRVDDCDDGVSTLGADMTVDGRWSVNSSNGYQHMGLRQQGTGGGRSYTMSPHPGTQIHRGSSPANQAKKPASAFFPATHPTGGGSIRSHHSDNIVYYGDTNGTSNNNGIDAMANNFMLYESDRCDAQLPAFHKVPPPPDKKSLGRTIMRSLTPQRMTGVAASGNASAGSGQQHARDATPNSFNGQPQQQQRGRSSTRGKDNRHVLDPEVMDAIRMMHHRSKSPVGRRETLVQDFEGQQYINPESSPYPQASYNNRSSRQLASDIAHPHDSSLQKIYGGKSNNKYQGQGDDFNPNQWENESTEERDDHPTVYGITSMAAPPGLQKSRSASTLINKTRLHQQQKQRGAPNKNNKMSLFKKKRFPVIIPPTNVKHGQAILTRDSFTTIVSPPKIAIHKTNAIVTSDRFVHFYSLAHNRWVQTTTVSLPNTHGLSLALFNDTAVIGVPYDRNSKGMLTGSAYIFERDSKTQTWYQVKKIVPKKVQEYSCVGFSVAICDNVVSVGVPELGATCFSMNGAGGGGSGSVYVYQRADQFKWMLMSNLTMAQNNVDPRTLAPPGGFLVPPTSNFGTIVALGHKIMVVSNFYRPNDCAVSDTSLFVYEYDESLKQKWRLIQSDLLSTEEQRRNFGSRIALTANGEGIFVGCHSEVNPTEILYFKRKRQVDIYGKRSFQLQQVINIQEKCDITQIHVDAQDNFIVGTLNSNRVYVYRKVHDLRTLEDQGWRLVAKVVDDSLDGESFGEHVVLSHDSILVGTANNVYSYSLDGWMTAKKKTSRSEFIRSFSPMRFRTSA